MEWPQVHLLFSPRKVKTIFINFLIERNIDGRVNLSRTRTLLTFLCNTSHLLNLLLIKRVRSLPTSAHLWRRGVWPATIFCGQYLPTKTNKNFNQPMIFSCFSSLDKLTDNLICSFFQFQSIRATQRLFFCPNEQLLPRGF